VYYTKYWWIPHFTTVGELILKYTGEYNAYFASVVNCMSSYKLYRNLETSWALLVYEIPSSNVIILWKPKILYLK
jgi:hypothetical protein